MISPFFLYALSNDMNTSNRMAEYNAKSSAVRTGSCDVLLLISMQFSDFTGSAKAEIL